MDKTISAAEANRRFSEILRGARDGETYVVTSHGRAVARITPVSEAQDAAKRAALLRRLKSQRVGRKGTLRWKRDELYGD
jgi:prevent-host-death family protein